VFAFGDVLGFGFGGFLDSFLPLSLLPMSQSSQSLARCATPLWVSSCTTSIPASVAVSHGKRYYEKSVSVPGMVLFPPLSGKVDAAILLSIAEVVKWQTHRLEGAAPQGIGVQVPSSAPRV
jgi:hypothetical protein